MAEHPIEGLMKSALDSIAQMIDVNTILGDPVETSDGHVIMPVSKVSLGFAAGGTEWESGDRGQRSQDTSGSGGQLPFGGGSGAGISLNPMGFLVLNNSGVRFLPVSGEAVFDRLLDVVPDLITKLATPAAKRTTTTTTLV
ncbi:MAG: GerW family sporulation protein [Bacillota bacterium]|nr:sporulation protein YtfJ [Bacillota bacterium]